MGPSFQDEFAQRRSRPPDAGRFLADAIDGPVGIAPVTCSSPSLVMMWLDDGTGGFAKRESTARRKPVPAALEASGAGFRLGWPVENATVSDAGIVQQNVQHFVQRKGIASYKMFDLLVFCY